MSRERKFRELSQQKRPIGCQPTNLPCLRLRCNDSQGTGGKVRFDVECMNAKINTGRKSRLHERAHHGLGTNVQREMPPRKE